MPFPHIPIGLVTCFSKQLWNNLCEPQFADVRQLANNLKDLLLDLRTERIRVEDLITRARGREKNTEEMQRWVNKAIQIEQAVANWEETISNNRGCCHALHLDWRSRHRLSRDARNMIHVIQDLRANENFIRNFSSPPRVLNVEDIYRPDFLPLASSMAAIEEIMDGLKSKTKNIIGVHGDGGIGKTRVVEQVAKRARDENLFDKVIFATVSQTPNVKLIQDRIAKYLGFKIEEEGEYLRQTRLSGRLKQVNKVLIILDNAWEELDLVSVGIPYDNEHEGCKIIVTSRFLDVCNGMNATIWVAIQELSEEDALKLFKTKAGNHDSTDPLDRAAKEMVRQCRYNPNLILTVGSALRNKPPDQWNAEIQRVRESTSFGF